MKRLAAQLALVSAVACGAGATTETGSGVEGRATIGPTCPVVREGEDCDDRPVQATLLVVDASGDVVARIETEADGTFRQALAPGSYTLEADPDAVPPGGMRQAVELPFEVRPGTYTNVDVSFDSGIR